MDIIKKRKQISPLRLVFAECLAMSVISACVCGILYRFANVSETGISFLPLAQLVTGIIAFAMVAWKDKLLSKISFPAFLVNLSAIYGVLLFEFLLYWGLRSFLYLALAAVILFVLTAITGYLFGPQINGKKIYMICGIIFILGITCEIVCISFNHEAVSYSIIISTGLCAGLLNMADFSRYNRIMGRLTGQTNSSRTDFEELALIFFINLISGMAATDAWRLASKLSLYKNFKKLTY